MTCSDGAHDFQFRDCGDSNDTFVCDCGQAMALFDSSTGDMIAIRSTA